MACGLTSGIGLACADLKRVGGLNKRVWLYNIDDLRTGIDVTQATITTLNFQTYASLYKFEGVKYTHSAECKFNRSDSGNVTWDHFVNLRINNTTGAEDQILESMAVAEMGAIVQTNNNDFLLYGPQNGLIMMEASDPTGTKSGDDEFTTLKLQGTEPTLAKRLVLSAGTSGNIIQQTLFYLNAITSSTITT